MYYYEIWFYFYDQYDAIAGATIEDPRTDYTEEFTFYCKTENPITSLEEMIAHCQKAFPVTEKFNVDKINCIDPKHYEHMSRFLEIDAAEFERSCGVPARKNIHLIVGPSGVGKTAIVNELCKRYGLKAVESYTDRPPRYEGETGHIFLSPAEFDKLPPLYAYVEIEGFRYGATAEMIGQCDLYVVEPSGVRYIREHYTGKKGIKVIGLTAGEPVLRSRMRKRGDSAKAIQARIDADKVLFAKYSSLCENTLIQNSDLNATVEFIYESIRYWERETVTCYEP